MRNNTLVLLGLLGLALVQLLGGAHGFVVPCVPASPVAAAGKTAVARGQLKTQQLKSAAFAPVPTTLLAAGDGEDDAASEDVGPLGVAAIGLGLVANPVVFWSEWTLKTTGCGLPAGPGGALGALEGVSYLVVAGIFIWSIANKVRTGKGLPAGPAGLLGAVEGLSFLAMLAGVVIAGLTYADYGSIPEAVPVEGGRCSGI